MLQTSRRTEQSDTAFCVVSKVAYLAIFIWQIAQACVATEIPTSQQGWPQWRGPRSNNQALSAAPVHWDAEAGIKWKIATKGYGHASPCIFDNQIFLACAELSPPRQFLVAYDKFSGKQRWLAELHSHQLPKIHENNSHASATPACDGKLIYQLFASHDSLWALAISITGELKWQKRIGAFTHANGLGSSPAIYQGMLLICSDNQAEPCLVGLDCQTGNEVWRRPRPRSDNSATPIVANVAGRDQFLINGAYELSAFDPLTGKQLWVAYHETEVSASTVAYDNECVYGSGNVPQPTRVAVQANGSGNITNSHVLWKSNKSINYVPSCLAVDDKLFLVTDTGIALCHDARTDQQYWKKRLSDAFYASPLLAGELIYALSHSGVMHVFQANTNFEEIARNELAETCFATPAICDGKIYVRTTESLLCIEGKLQ